MAEATTFPTDDVTLHLLIAACKINPDTGRTHLQDFLEMGARVKSETQIDGFGDGVPIYEVEFEEGFEPFSEHEAIIALAQEILCLRDQKG